MLTQVLFQASEGPQNGSFCVNRQGNGQLGNQQPQESDDEKLDKLVKKSQEVLLKIHTVFPFDLFTDELVVDENKITFIYRDFPGTERVHIIMVKNITDVIVDTNPFFATLKIVDQGYKENIVGMEFLRRTDAFEAQKIIQGLVVIDKQPDKDRADLTKMKTEEVIEKIEEVGDSTR